MGVCFWGYFEIFSKYLLNRTEIVEKKYLRANFILRGNYGFVGNTAEKSRLELQETS